MKLCFDHLIFNELLNTATIKIRNILIIINELILSVLDMLDIFSVFNLFF